MTDGGYSLVDLQSLTNFNLFKIYYNNGGAD